jgi:hypothetical protein
VNDPTQPRQLTTATGGSRLSVWGARTRPKFSLVLSESTSAEQLEAMLARAAAAWASLPSRFAAVPPAALRRTQRLTEAEEPAMDEPIDFGGDGGG